MTIDRRERFDEVIGLTLLGEVADEVVIACASAMNDALGRTERGTLELAGAILQALAAPRSPTLPPTATARSFIVGQSSAEQIRHSFPSDDPPDFAALSQAMERYLNVEDVSGLVDVQDFFARLAARTLQTVGSLSHPERPEATWTKLAFNS